MQALLFEMEPRDGHEDHYFSHAAKLRPILTKHDGLIFIERFKSLSRPQVILSHSLWRDEASIARWRTDRQHHKSQTAGRFKHFQDYRIRISHALRFEERDTEVKEWSHDGAYSIPHVAADRYLVLHRTRNQPKIQDGETFASVTEAGSYFSVIEVANEAEGHSKIDEAVHDTGLLTVLLTRVSRDYGMYDRAEAPQYFETVEKPEA